MRLFLLSFLFLSCKLYSQDIIVKQVWGEVEFIDKSTSQIVNGTILTGKKGDIVLLSEGSRIWLRIGNELSLFSYQIDNNIFSLDKLINKKPSENVITTQENSEIEKILTVLFSGNHHDDIEIKGLNVGAYSGTSRGAFLGDNVIVFDDINVNTGISICLNWSDYILTEADTNFSITVNNTNHNVLTSVVEGTSFDMDITLESPFYNEMFVIISSLNTDLILKGKIIGPHLFDDEFESLLSLKSLALKDLSVKNQFYHELFIDALIKFELNNSALYYLNLMSVDKPTNYLSYKLVY